MGACGITFAIIIERLRTVVDEGMDQHGKAATKAMLDRTWDASEMKGILVHVSSLESPPDRFEHVGWLTSRRIEFQLDF